MKLISTGLVCHDFFSFFLSRTILSHPCVLRLISSKPRIHVHLRCLPIATNRFDGNSFALTFNVPHPAVMCRGMMQNPTGNVVIFFEIERVW